MIANIEAEQSHLSLGELSCLLEGQSRVKEKSEPIVQAIRQE